MKRTWFGTIAAGVATVGMTLPTAGLANPPRSESQVIGNQDVALRDGGLLIGQVVNQQGTAVANAAVSIRHGQHEVVRTTTDANGIFAVKSLRGGQYEILSENGARSYRLWAPNTAPPAARPAALLVTGESVVRGQAHPPYVPGHHGMGQGWVAWMKAHPYLTAGAVATAVAVPLAFIDDDDENGS